MKSLAIEREFGSGGREVGTKVAKLAGIPYYDEELLMKAAQDQGLSVEAFKYYDEKRTGSFLYDLAAYSNYAYGNKSNSVYELFDGIEKTIQKLELEGPGVFIGRCSTEILKNRKNVLRVFIYSSDAEKRKKRLMKMEGFSEAEVEKTMERTDKQRSNYFHFWTQKDWKDEANYDMKLNTGTLSIDDCARILYDAIQT